MLEHNGHNKKVQSSIRCLIIILEKNWFIITKQKAKKTVYNTKQRDPIMAPSFEGIPVTVRSMHHTSVLLTRIHAILGRIVTLYLAFLCPLNCSFDLIKTQ